MDLWEREEVVLIVRVDVQKDVPLFVQVDHAVREKCLGGVGAC